MAQNDTKLVMDISPWPQGHGFAGGKQWWEHMSEQNEQKRLDNLMGVALLDSEVCERLLSGSDDTLMSAFGISAETQHRLKSAQASSLTDLAQALTHNRDSNEMGFFVEEAS
ncbi:MAG: hypothetical protein ABI690_09290 [Chloroflexota bacterium]